MSTQIFTEEHLNHYLKLYLKDEIKKCEERINSAKYTLELEQCLPENRTQAQRSLEIFSFRKFHLHIQLEGLESPWLRSKQLTKIVETKLRSEETKLLIEECYEQDIESLNVNDF